MKIAIHGAAGTGREALALGLAGALKNHRGNSIKILVSPPVGLPHVDFALLCGLDWPGVHSHPGQGACAKREFEDQRLRDALIEAGVKFQVIYGCGEARIANALKAIDAASCTAPTAGSGNAAQSLNARGKLKWQWECDKCGDSSCEHRLFSELLR